MVNTKTVDYLGLQLSVNDDVKYVAMESDGRLYGFTKRPYLNPGYIWVTPGDIFYIDKCFIDVHWAKSLRKI